MKKDLGEVLGLYPSPVIVDAIPEPKWINRRYLRDRGF